MQLLDAVETAQIWEATNVDATMMANRATVQTIFEYGESLHQGKIISFNGGDYQVSSYRGVALRARKLAAALRGLGVKKGDVVASYCGNHQPHLEAYLAVPCLGAVLHTLNTRLHVDQLALMIGQLKDKVLIADASLLRTIAPILPELASVTAVIVVGQAGDPPVYEIPVHDYETLLDSAPPLEDWPALDEAAAAVACYTSGTTGQPKGILYSHRSIFMHSLAVMGVDTVAISRRDRILLLPPMFHANAWGLPHTAWFAGSDLILPGPHLQSGAIRRMIADWKPTYTSMVPTLINDLLLADEQEPIDMSSFRVLVSGGSAVSEALIRRVYQRWNIPVLQGWGMTETSPLCSFAHPPPEASVEDAFSWRVKSGRPVPGMAVRLRNDEDREVAWDGESLGELQLRGPWVTGRYYGAAGEDCFTADGWLRTGDIGTIDRWGYVVLKDRAKDVIKSGGEWISSVELENRLAHHPDIAEVAVVAIADKRWEERPLAVVVLRRTAAEDARALRSILEGKVARFWLPEYWSFVDAIPRTSVGKVDKKALREALAAGELSYQKLEPASET